MGRRWEGEMERGGRKWWMEKVMRCDAVCDMVRMGEDYVPF